MKPRSFSEYLQSRRLFGKDMSGTKNERAIKTGAQNIRRIN
jgi:hypothetical protein